MEATVVEILAKFRAEVGDFNNRVRQVEDQLQSLQNATQRSSDGISNSFSGMENAARQFGQTMGAVSAVATGALVAFGVQSFNAAARVEELDVALQAVGSSTGKGYEALREAAYAVKGVGIEMEIAQQSVLKFAQNNLDLASASKVARVAQDLAIIGGMNSTDTYNRLTHAIITGRSEVLKSVGIQKSAGQAYAQFAATLGKTTKELTYQEKQAAVLSLVLDEGARVAGAYEAAMTSPGKVLRSFARITNELQVAMGTALTRAFGPMIMETYNLYKEIVKLVSEGGALYPVIQALGDVFTNLATPLTNVFKKISEIAKKFNGASASADEAIAKYEKLSPVFENLGTQIQRFLPLLGAVGAGFAVFGGADIMASVPILGKLLSYMNPYVTAIAILVALSPKLQSAFGELVAALQPLVPVFLAVGTVITDIVNIGILILAKTISFLATLITNLINFVKRFATVFKVLGGLALMVAAGFLAFNIQMAITIVRQKTAALWTQILAVRTALMAKATATMTRAQRALNLAMAFNPIGLIVAAVAALTVGFMLLWNNSEAFRNGVISLAKTALPIFANIVRAIGPIGETILKIVTGPMRGLLWALSKLKMPGAQSALDFINKGLDSVSEWANKAADGIDNMVGKLDGLKDFRFKIPKFDMGFVKPKEEEKTVFEGDGGDGGGDGLEEELSRTITALQEALDKYSDFIKYEFVPGFMVSAEKGRETIGKSLDLLKNLFDEKAKGLKGKALTSLMSVYDSIKKYVRGFIPTVEELGAAFEALNEQLDEATKRMNDAVSERASAVRDLNALLRQPFGEPSEIKKGLSSSEATIDSMIAMYDKLVDVVNRRFTEIEPAKRDALLAFLESTTAQLIDLAKKRSAAITEWEKQDKKLQELISAQEDFGKQLLSTVKNYGRALFDISDTNEQAVVKAIKTSTGVIITQVETATSGLEGVQKQLQDRLKKIKDFANNIRALLARGLNRDYVRQLLEAGPEAAGGLATLLTTAGADQITAINDLYNEIGNISDQFSTEMAGEFYNNQIAAQQAIVQAAQDDVTNIQNAMDMLRTAITSKLDVLVTDGANIGNDMIQGIIDKLNERKSELVAAAEAIATAIAAAMAKAYASVGGSQLPLPPTSTDMPGDVGSGADMSTRLVDGMYMDGDIVINNYMPGGLLSNPQSLNQALRLMGLQRR